MQDDVHGAVETTGGSNGGNGGRRERRTFDPKEKARIVLEGLKAGSAAEVYKKEDIAANLFYRWQKTFLEGGTAALSGEKLPEQDVAECGEDTIAYQAMVNENQMLKAAVAQLYLENSELRRAHHVGFNPFAMTG